MAAPSPVVAAPPGGTPAPDRVARWLLGGAGAELAFLLVTAVFLVCLYRPAAAMGRQPNGHTPLGG